MRLLIRCSAQLERPGRDRDQNVAQLDRSGRRPEASLCSGVSSEQGRQQIQLSPCCTTEPGVHEKITVRAGQACSGLRGRDVGKLAAASSAVLPHLRLLSFHLLCLLGLSLQAALFSCLMECKERGVFFLHLSTLS